MTAPRRGTSLRRCRSSPHRSGRRGSRSPRKPVGSTGVAHMGSTVMLPQWPQTQDQFGTADACANRRHDYVGRNIRMTLRTIAFIAMLGWAGAAAAQTTAVSPDTTNLEVTP